MIASKVVTIPLPHGRDWTYYADLNILALAPHLDAEGQQRCVDEFAEQWRQSMRERLSGISVEEKPPSPRLGTAAAAVLASMLLTTDPSASVV